VCWWDTIDRQVWDMFGEEGEGLVDCIVLMGAGVTSTVGVIAVDHQYHVLLGRLQVLGCSLARVLHPSSWDVTCSHIQVAEVVTQGHRFGAVKGWLVHGRQVVWQQRWGQSSAGFVVVACKRFMQQCKESLHFVCKLLYLTL